MKAIVTYYSDKNGLAVTITCLQAQTMPPEAIIIIDTSPDKSGLDIARRFNTNEVPVIVECARVGIYEAWNRGIEIADGSDVLIMNDDLLFPMNTIAILDLVRRNVNAYSIVPTTPGKAHYSDRVNLPFKWESEAPVIVGEDQKYHFDYTKLTRVPWMPGFCFMLTKECIRDVGLFDTRYEIWYGDDDYQNRIFEKCVEQGEKELAALEKNKDKKTEEFLPEAIIQIDDLKIYHFGGTSYKYKSSPIQRKIQKDLKVYKKRWPSSKPMEIDVNS